VKALGARCCCRRFSLEIKFLSEFTSSGLFSFVEELDPMWFSLVKRRLLFIADELRENVEQALWLALPYKLLLRF